MTTLTRRSVLAAAAALVAGPALAACSTTGTSDGSSGGSGRTGTKTISFLTFETPNLTAAYWDAAIKRVTDKYPDIKVKKLVSPTADGRTDYAKQLLQSGQFPDVMIARLPGRLRRGR